MRLRLRRLAHRERLLARLYIEVVNIVIVYDVCHLGSSWRVRTTCWILRSTVELRRTTRNCYDLLSLIHLARRGRHEWSLIYVRGSIRLASVVYVCCQLMRRGLLRLTIQISVLQKLARHHLLGWPMGVELLNIRCGPIHGTLPGNTLFLGDLRGRVERGSKLVKALAHHLSTRW